MADRQQPIPTYYPATRVRLIVRLEDYGNPNTPAAPTKPTTLRKGITAKDSVLQVQSVNGAFVLVGPGDDPNSVGSPQQQQASSDGFTHVIDGVIPINANHKQNGIRTAETLTLSIQFGDMPIDPRVIRSCAVQYFAGTISAEEYQRGMNGQVREPANGTNLALPLNVIPDNYVDSSGRPRTNLRFEGWVDDWSDEFPDGDLPIINLECSDNTRLLIDQDAPPKLTIGTDQPIDLAIANYLANFPQFRGLSVVYQPTVSRDKIPVLKQVLKATAFQPKLGPAPAGGGTSKLKVWDYITDVAGSIGHVVRFQGTQCIIQLPRTLYDARLPARSDDPFTGRVLPDGTTLSRRLYVYGNNVAELKFKRKYAQFSPTCIEVRSYSISKKTTLVARFPEKNDRVKRLNPGDSADQKWTVLRIRGIEDLPTLRKVAQSAYEQIGRRELGASLRTKALGSFGGGNLDPDALDVKPGDALEVIFGSADSGNNNTALDVDQQMKSRAAEFLQELGFSADFATAYQTAVNNIGLPFTFRVRTVEVEWDGESDAMTLNFDLINYVEIRADKQLPAGEEITPDDVVGNSSQPVTVSDSDLGVGI